MKYINCEGVCVIEFLFFIWMVGYWCRKNVVELRFVKDYYFKFGDNIILFIME